MDFMETSLEEKLDANVCLWDELPDDVKCKILALVPTSMDKLRLRLVSKSWSELLDSADAHGLEAEPLTLPSGHIFEAPLRILEHVRALFLVCESAQLKAAIPEGLERLAWQQLDLECTASLQKTLPKLEDLSFYFNPQSIGRTLNPFVSCELPALKRLRLPGLPPSTPGAQSIVPSCEWLQGIPGLTHLSYRSRSFLEYKLPINCTLHIDFDIDGCASAACPVPCVPPNVSCALTSISIRVPRMSYNLFQDSASLGLTSLSICSALTKVQVIMPELGPYLRVTITGINRLPTSVKAIEVVCEKISCVHYAPGTRIGLVRMEPWPKGKLGATDGSKMYIVTRL